MVIIETTCYLILMNSDDPVDAELLDLSPGSFRAQQEESKYFGLIFNVSILFSFHYRYYHLSSKQSLLTQSPKLTFFGRHQLATEIFFQSPDKKMWLPKSIKFFSCTSLLFLQPLYSYQILHC